MHLTLDVDHRPIRLFALEPAATDHPHPALVLLHGAGGNLDFWTSRLAPFLQEAGVALYAPQYFDRTGTVRADLATIADGVHTPQWIDTVDHALRLVASRPGVDPNRMVLAGISLGAFLALALAADLSASPDRHVRRRLRALVAVSGGLVDPYAARATVDLPPTLILHGATDTVVPVSYAHALDARLTALDVAHRTEILPGEGHWFSSAAVPRLLLAVSGFLQAHLADPTPDRPM